MLGHLLLEGGCCDVVRFHTKGHPTFVSDALSDDVIGTINFLAGIEDGNKAHEATSALAAKLQEHLKSHRFMLDDDLFWCQPTAFWDMPRHVMNKLSTSSLVFVKGDANYRRLLGERQWPLDTPAKEVLSYWQVPVCALRTFKAEIGCGVSKESVARAEELDKRWLVSGKWGVVQLKE